MLGLLWAKWRSGGAIYPLVAHLVDAATVAEVLLDEWVPQQVADREGVRASVVAGAALHDLGKATPVFQGQQFARHRSPGFDLHLEHLARHGLAAHPPRWAGTQVAEFSHWLIRRHEFASAVWATGRMQDAGGGGLAAVVAGHHGRWRIPEGYEPDEQAAGRYYDWWLTDPAWTDVRDQMVDTVEDVMGIDRGVALAAGLVPLVTGLVVLADWVASDIADRDPQVHGSWSEHRSRRRGDAVEAVRALLGTPARPPGGFTQVFGFEPSRPVQQVMVQSGVAGLRVVMAPTGEGKTEAALGHWLTNAADRQGIFFALPTMATADAMFGRVRAFFSGADSTVAVLAHGRSILNQFYAMTDRALEAEVHDEGGLRPGRWFTGNSRAALAPVTVGTVDQALLGVLRHRYNVLRLAGLATKTVVFDEVHSYDPYMALLLERFLAWAGELGIDVVLLSATLPTERLHAYLRAYGHTAAVADVIYPSVVAVDRGRGVTVDPLDASARATTIQLHHHPVEELVAGTVSLVRDLRRRYPTAKVGVIVNTVRRCQAVAQALQDGGEPVEVMHSRFPAAVRGRQVTAAISRYGKASMTGAGTMVATQVVEQSIDLDFDLLVTELCPAASLVQRAGRTFRHIHDPVRRSRPAGLSAPAVHVVRPDPFPTGMWDWLPYPTASVQQTWEHGLDMGQRRSIRVPEDVQLVIDASHVTFDTLVATAGTDQEAAVEGQVLSEAVQRQNASLRVIPSPDQLRADTIRALEAFTAGGDGTGEYQTRWVTDPAVDVLLVGNDADTWAGPLPPRPSRQELIDLLGCVVPLTGAARNATLPDTTTPEGLGLAWDDTHLADVVILDLDRQPQHRLDPTLGFLHAEGPRP